MVFCGPGASTASTEVKPAAARNCRAVCSPQAVPSPAPPSAKETVMQCRTLTPYIHGPKGLPTFSSRLLEALGSTTRYKIGEHTSELQSHHDLVCRLLL